ncbi:hypothetical protein BDV19DRAFT_386834 [Aspergillus venezuelensis]
MPSFFGNSARRGSETGARSSVVSSSSSRRSMWERELDPSDSASQVSAPRSSHRSHHSSRHSASRSSRHSTSSSRMSDARTVTPSKYTSSRMSSSYRGPSRFSRPGDAPDLQRADLMRRGSSRVTSVSGVPDMGSAGAVAPYRSGMYKIQEVPSTGHPSVVSLSTRATSCAPSSPTSGMSASRNGGAVLVIVGAVFAVLHRGTVRLFRLLVTLLGQRGRMFMLGIGLIKCLGQMELAF